MITELARQVIFILVAEVIQVSGHRAIDMLEGVYNTPQKLDS
jgi:hypothetical protein